MLAVMHDRPALVRELLARGADPNIADTDGRMPLSIAREKHRGALIRALLAAGAR
jgi:ankyrin repeat protein